MMKIRLHIILVLSVFTFCSTPKTIIETKLIKGIIHDAYDIPQEGGEIAVKGTDRKVISDADGKFEIEATKGDILTIQLPNGAYDEIIVTSKKEYSITLPNIIYGYGPFGDVE